MPAPLPRARTPCLHPALRPLFCFFNDTATTEIYTLSLHDALPISLPRGQQNFWDGNIPAPLKRGRSEEHTSELQSPCNLVCRLLLENTTRKIFLARTSQTTSPGLVGLASGVPS